MSDKRTTEFLDEELSKKDDSSDQRQADILKKVSSKQGQSALFEFGFVRFWSVIVDYLHTFSGSNGKPKDSEKVLPDE